MAVITTTAIVRYRDSIALKSRDLLTASLRFSVLFLITALIIALSFVCDLAFRESLPIIALLYCVLAVGALAGIGWCIIVIVSTVVILVTDNVRRFVFRRMSIRSIEVKPTGGHAAN